MDYYNKYIKYKTKYLNLKQKGGAKVKYVLLAYFDKDSIGNILKNTYQEVMSKIDSKYIDTTWNNSVPLSHTTIVYGPEVSDELPEYPLISLEELYPKFEEKYNKTIIDDLIFEGVSLFISINRIVIKAEFKSNKLNEIREYLFKCSDLMKEYEIKWKKMLDEDKEEIKKMNLFPNLTEGNNNWIHSTLGVLNPKNKDGVLITENELKELLNFTKKRLSEQGLIIGNKYKLDEMILRTPKTKKLIKLW